MNEYSYKVNIKNNDHAQTKQYLNAIQHYTICINTELVSKLRGDRQAEKRGIRLVAMRERMLCMAIMYIPKEET